MTSGLDKNVLAEIIKIIANRQQVEKIVLFGSWATKRAKRTSDIDLAVFGCDLSDSDLSLIRFDLEENIKTPLKFDVLHFEILTKESLKEDILKEGIILYESKKN